MKQGHALFVRQFWPVPLLLALLLLPFGCSQKQKTVPPPPVAGAGMELVLLHTNDTHSHLAGIDKYGNPCFEDSQCRGGMARIAAAIRARKAQSDNVLALDAGDFFQGTLFYSVHKWPVIAAVNAHMPYDAMTLGNHEFDDGCDALKKFLEKTTFPVVGANLKPQPGCPLRNSTIENWIIRQVRGTSVGIVGLANDEVRHLASACEHTTFDAAATALRRAVQELQARNVSHIVALTHLGLPADRELARTVDGVDVIIGGHTHSYLGPDSREGPYPLVEKSPSGKPVLVVTAKNATQYLGDLTVVFDREGVPLRWSGGARELMPEDPGDPVIRRIINSYTGSLENFRKMKIGSHNLQYADGMDACRAGDCLSGMLLVDAMLEYARPFGATLALANGGTIRSALAPGDITRSDLMTLIPFRNIMELRRYTGAQLLQALEHGVAEEDGKGPRLLQTAGLRYTVDASRPTGQRIVSAETLDEKGNAAPIDKANTYTTILSNYLTRGGDGYAVLAQGEAISFSNPADVEVLEAYVKKHSPLPMPTAGRITFR